MNILVLNWRDSKHPEAGGAEVHFREIFRRLVSYGHNVYLLATGFKGAPSTDIQDGIKVYRWGHTYTFNWESPLLIAQIRKIHQIDVIIDDVNKIPFFSPRWFPRIPTAAFFHHLFGPTIFELTAYPFARYVLFLEKLSRWGYQNVPVCTVSKSTASELLDLGLKEKNLTIIENSVDTEYFSPSESVKKKDNMLLYTGRIKSYKNVEILIKALNVLNSKGREFQLCIAGSGDNEQALKSLVDRMSLNQWVTFEGQISEERKLQLYRESTLFVNPSMKEGWGITNIEANACGTAVIANDAPGLRDSVLDGQTGVLYSSNDLDSLVKAIDGLMNDRAKRQSLEFQGRQWALQFSWDRSAERVEEWISKVVLKN